MGLNQGRSWDQNMGVFAWWSYGYPLLTIVVGVYRYLNHGIVNQCGAPVYDSVQLVNITPISL
jgi:hypothetical protein